MDIHIWLRHRLDWTDEEAAEAALLPGLERPVALWNSTFTMPYHLFRARLREIAAQSLAATGIPQTEWDQIPPDALVLPIDDDDWFAPHIGERLHAQLGPEHVGAHWRSSWLQRPTSIRHTIYLMQRRVMPSTPYYIATTNNYALVKKAVPRSFFPDHVAVSNWMEPDPEARGVKAIPERLSLANRTLGSLTSLMLNMRKRKESVSSRRTLIWKYLRYRRYYRRDPEPGLEWTVPYMAQMDELMRELRPKHRLTGSSGPGAPRRS